MGLQWAGYYLKNIKNRFEVTEGSCGKSIVQIETSRQLDPMLSDEGLRWEVTLCGERM